MGLINPMFRQAISIIKMSPKHYFDLLKNKTEFFIDNGFLVFSENFYERSGDFSICYYLDQNNETLKVSFYLGWRDNFMNQVVYNGNTLWFEEFLKACNISFEKKEIYAQMNDRMGHFNNDLERALIKNVELIKEALPILLNKNKMDDIFS